MQDASTVIPNDLLIRALEHAARQDWAASRLLLERAAVEDPASRHPARMLLWEVCQALGDPEAGIRHLRAAVRENPLTVRPCAAPQRRVLAITVPGDFQANLPLAPLLDPAATELYTLWLADPDAVLADPLKALAPHLPAFHCAFIAIAEDARHGRALQAADALIDALEVPCINRGDRIAGVSRHGAAQLLQDLPDSIVPGQAQLTRAALTEDALACLRAAELCFPLIIRPCHSHAGKGLERLADRDELRSYLERNADSEAFFVAPFIDYRSTDGLWRKYRVIFVNGQPFPFHLAIHDDWAIWYYNAGMHVHAARRDEEARFLEDIRSAFPPRAIRALEELSRRVGLDYFGLDCSVMPDGRLLVFEVETGMIVHAQDCPDLYPYKRLYVPRIMHAVERMIDARIAEHRPG